ncbi:MAG: cation:proton antiporter [SAR202 cluster bacterium]|nr:cation:proton antiporter [SAR202 cluster bacterium]
MFSVSPGMESHFADIATHLVFQLAVILAAAKLAGELCDRFLKIPSVLGELVVGIIIGPYALGGLSAFGLQPLFELNAHSDGGFPLSQELFAVSQIAAIVLLFAAGLETDLKQFLRYAGPASGVAIGGVLVPFIFGVVATFLFKPGGIAGDQLMYSALFVGSVMTATSVGITARVLSDLKQLDSSEGVTVLAAAVVDDVLGILVLTVVVGLASPDGAFSLSNIVTTGIKALGFWIALMVGGILCSKYISIAFLSFRGTGAPLALAMALAFVASGLAESFGLAMIIGAYTIGLAISGTNLARHIEESVMSVYHVFVPIFFVVMGMMVDVSAMKSVITFGIVLSILAIISKVAGSGLPALAVGFNRRGAWRIGIGMLPRGEVALIMAGIGLSRGIIGADVFGIAIMMTVITTLLAPIILVPAFKNGGQGTR